jgi:hypothetical protein
MVIYKLKLYIFEREGSGIYQKAKWCHTFNMSDIENITMIPFDDLLMKHEHPILPG